MSSNINYKPLFVEKIEEFLEKCPEYTLGELLYCILTQLSKSNTPVDTSPPLTIKSLLFIDCLSLINYDSDYNFGSQPG